MSKAKTAVYLMISVIVLITIVFLVSDRVKKQKKKNRLQNSEKKEQIVLFIDSRRRLFSNQIGKYRFHFC